MAAENSALPSQEYITYIKIENSYINCNYILTFLLYL